MRLTTAQKVLDRLSLQTSRIGNVESANSALDAATPIVENAIGSPLSEIERLDWFSFVPGGFDKSTTLRVNLIQQFVDGDVEVYFSDTSMPVNLDGSPTLVDAADISVFRAEGFIALGVLPSIRADGNILVKYSAGFLSESTDIPIWIQEAAISVAIRFLHSQGPGHNKKDAAKLSFELKRVVYDTYKSHVRQKTIGIFPYSSEEV